MQITIKRTIIIELLLILILIELKSQINIKNISILEKRKNDSSFIILGDTQRACFFELGMEKNDEVRPMILKKIANENPAFIIHLGDFVCFGSSNDDWNKFDYFSRFIKEKHIPIFPVLGNHDYFGNNKTALKNFFSRFPQLNQNKWYSFTFHKIAYIMLNSNFDNLTENENKSQQKWYINSLNKFQSDTSIKIIVIACHHAPFTNSTVVSDNELVQKFFVNPMINIKKAKLFFTGHCHSYEHFIKFNKHFIVTGGGSGARHKLKDKLKYIDNFQGVKLRNFHYCKATLQNSGILIQMIYLNDKHDKWNIGQDFIIKYDDI